MLCSGILHATSYLNFLRTALCPTGDCCSPERLRASLCTVAAQERARCFYRGCVAVKDCRISMLAAGTWLFRCANWRSLCFWVSLLVAGAANSQLVFSMTHFLMTTAAAKCLIFIFLICATTLRLPVSVPTLFVVSVLTCIERPSAAAH